MGPSYIPTQLTIQKRVPLVGRCRQRREIGSMLSRRWKLEYPPSWEANWFLPEACGWLRAG